MVRTAINFYSVRELDEPMLDILDRVSEAGYSEVQFAGGFWEATASELATRVEDHDLDLPPPHVNIEPLEDDIEPKPRCSNSTSAGRWSVAPIRPNSSNGTATVSKYYT
jgi:hypothetical protein